MLLLREAAAMKLDAKGRCCGRKPIDYKGRRGSYETPHKYCPRCDRSYDRVTDQQIENWAWELNEGDFFCRKGSTNTSEVYK
jgi:hypothetical protein